MINREFSERITIKSLLIPNKCTNYEGLTTNNVLSIDEDKIIQQNPASHDFTIYKGVSFGITFVYKNKDTRIPYNLTGYTVEGKAFLINNKDIEFNLHPIIAEDASTGKIIVSLTPEETSSIYLETCGTYYHYYINLISSTGYKYRILMGNIRVCQ